MLPRDTGVNSRTSTEIQDVPDASVAGAIAEQWLHRLSVLTREALAVVYRGSGFHKAPPGLLGRTGGFRKIRWTDRRRHKGKRGGLRVIYYYLMADTQIWLMTLYDKDTATDLSPAEKRVLKAATEKETQERASRRTRGRK